MLELVRSKKSVPVARKKAFSGKNINGNWRSCFSARVQTRPSSLIEQAYDVPDPQHRRLEESGQQLNTQRT